MLLEKSNFETPFSLYFIMGLTTGSSRDKHSIDLPWLPEGVTVVALNPYPYLCFG